MENINIDWNINPTLRTSKVIEIDDTHIGIVVKRADTYVLTATLEHLTAECIIHVVEASTGTHTIHLPTPPTKYIQDGRLYIQYQTNRYDAMGKQL